MSQFTAFLKNKLKFIFSLQGVVDLLDKVTKFKHDASLLMEREKVTISYKTHQIFDSCEVSCISSSSSYEQS